MLDMNSCHCIGIYLIGGNSFPNFYYSSNIGTNIFIISILSIVPANDLLPI